MKDLDVLLSMAWDHPSLEKAQRLWSQSGELQQLVRMDTVRERTRVMNMPAGYVEARGVTEQQAYSLLGEAWDLAQPEAWMRLAVLLERQSVMKLPLATPAMVAVRLANYGSRGT